MENKEKLSKQTNDLQKKEKIKTLDKDQLDSASGGSISAAVGLGALAGLGAVTAYSTHKALQKSGSKTVEPQKKPRLYTPITAPIEVKSVNLPTNDYQNIDELINKLYNANKEYVDRKSRTNAYPNNQIDDIDDVEKVLKV